MLVSLADGLELVSLTGVGVLSLLAGLHRFLRHRAVPVAPRPVTASILKPLCGLDDDLVANLESFADLDGAEVLLGVASTADAAWPVAVAMAAKHPGRFRVVLQRGEPGYNPKVNQLVTLAEEARHDLLVISDSNVLPDAGWLAEIDSLAKDPQNGVIVLPPVGGGSEDLGAALDALHIGVQVGPGLGVMRLLGKPLVVGKTMAVRRDTLRRLGGMEAFVDVLAEDWVMGERVERELGLRVAVGTTPVRNVCRRRSLRTFLDRYQRWSVIHRHAIGAPTYLSQGLLTPTAWAVLACVADPGRSTLGALLAVAAARVLQDLVVLAGWPDVDRRLALLAPLRDVAMALAWAYGWTANRVVWRGHTLRVATGTRLLPDTTPEPSTPIAL